MKNELLKKLLPAICIAAICSAAFALPGCSYLAYKAYTSITEKPVTPSDEEPDDGENEISDFVTEAYYVTESSTTDAGAIEGYKLLTLVDEETYTLDVYKQLTPAEGAAYTFELFHMQGSYTRELNTVTVATDVGVLVESNGEAQLFTNGETQDLRDSIYAEAIGDSRELALMSDGSFEAGGTSDATELLTSAASGAKVYRYTSFTSRPTYNTLTLFNDGTYVVSGFSLHSTNHDLTVGTFLGRGEYTTVESLCTEEYDVVNLGIGKGADYANNNGSDMWFDCQSESSYSQWYNLGIGSSFVLSVTEKGYTDQYGTEIAPWGFYFVDDADIGGGDDDDDNGDEQTLLSLVGTDNEAFVLEIYNDGTYYFCFTTYNASETGTWTIEDGELKLDCQGTINRTARNDDGSHTVEYISHTSSAMTQSYTISAEDWQVFAE